MLEIWKDIKGYEALYAVSNLGNVKGLNYKHTGKERILKPGKERKGYLHVTLCKEGKIKTFLIHRLVAEAFIPNPDNKPFINHRDETPNHNCVDNLEWCDRKYNNNYGTKNERMSKIMTNHPRLSTKIKCFDLETNKETIYPSIREAGRELNIKQGSIWYSIYKCNSPYKNRYIFSEINIEK